MIVNIAIYINNHGFYKEQTRPLVREHDPQNYKFPNIKIRS
jgi:hypothetical protein